MNTEVKSLLVSLCFILYAGHVAAAEREPLLRAHEAFMERDFKTMALELKTALVENPYDTLIRDNAVELLKKAYDVAEHDGIPADFKLPEEIQKMKIQVNFKQKDLPEYSLRVTGRTSQPQIFKKLVVLKYPNQIVLDKQGNVGEWSESTEDGEHEYELKGKDGRSSVSPGLYTIQIELNNGKTADGWFILDDDMNSTSTAKVKTPFMGETFDTATPTFKWTDFRSPQYKPYERRALWLGVARNEPPKYDWDEKWSFWQDSPSLQSITVGGELGKGVKSLENGRYVLIVHYSEKRRFGDLILERASVTLRPFAVNTIKMK